LEDYEEMVVNAFQFLLVRLKAKGEAADITTKDNISIPFGAIKRNSSMYAKPKKGLFQFLLVRLKVFVQLLSMPLPFYFNSFWCD